MQMAAPFYKTQLAEFNKATLQRCHASIPTGGWVRFCYLVLCMMKTCSLSQTLPFGSNPLTSGVRTVRALIVFRFSLWLAQ